MPGPPPMDLPPRRCQTCGGHYFRKRTPNRRLEDPKAFAARRYCSLECMKVAHRRQSPLDAMLRLLQTTRSADECWEWPGCRDDEGYGRIRTKGRQWRAHRWSWEQAHGPIKDGLVVCHHCDNPPCINPAHLFLDTAEANTRDRHAKSRDARGERSGTAKLTDEQAIAVMARLLVGKETATAIASELGVTKQVVSAIWRGRSWGHLFTGIG